jgi:L-threonylcarbamoyladenylate synthase
MLIYRPGAVTAEMIASVAGEVRVFIAAETLEDAAPESLPSPGVGLRHYAPRARLMLVDGECEMRDALSSLAAAGEQVGVMLPDGWNAGVKAQEFFWGPWGGEEVLARRLFAGLHKLDELGVAVIVCPVPKSGGLGDALRDRLQKAARQK